MPRDSNSHNHCIKSIQICFLTFSSDGAHAKFEKAVVVDLLLVLYSRGLCIIHPLYEKLGRGDIMFTPYHFVLTLSSVRRLFGAIRSVSYTNPVIPGWHLDPSCTFVADFENTFFCTTSTFMAFPGNPIYASKDLIDWKIASNCISRPSQMPEMRIATNQQFGGFFARDPPLSLRHFLSYLNMGKCRLSASQIQPFMDYRSIRCRILV